MNIVMAILLTLFAPNAASVAERAVVIAGDLPYCLQVSSSDGYRQVRTMFDLSVFSMRARSAGGIHSEFHAVLAVGAGASPRIYNWSYRKGGFDEIERMPIALVCSPVDQFVDRLSAFVASPDLGPQRIRSAGFDFVIPAAYHPRVINQISNPILVLRTNAPDFLPISESRPLGDLGLSVYLNLDRVEGWLSRTPNRIAEDRGEAIFGLRQRAIISYSRSGARVEHLELYDKNENGKVTTVIWCSAESALRVLKCPVIHFQNGLLYHFHIYRDDFGKWRSVCAKAVQVVDSFAASVGHRSEFMKLE